MSGPDTHRPYNLLFLCTGNSARSILAEAILRQDGGGRFVAYSAGSHPKGEVNRVALKTLEAFDYPAEGMRSKSWDEFARPGAPVMDFVITVCDDAAGEECPVWPGQPVSAHWGIEDPAKVVGSEVAKERAMALAFRYLKNRITAFVNLPIRSLDALSLQTRLNEIGGLEGATTPQTKAS
jgi:arsenate reductase